MSDHSSDKQIEKNPNGNDKNVKHEPREKKAVRAENVVVEIVPVKHSGQIPLRVPKHMRLDNVSRKHGVENSYSSQMSLGSDETERDRKVGERNKQGRNRRMYTQWKSIVLYLDGKEMGIVSNGSYMTWN